MSLWKRIAGKIRKTRERLAEGLQEVFSSGAQLDDEFFESLEEVLLLSDVGPETASSLSTSLRELACERGVADAEEARVLMEEVVAGILRKGAGGTSVDDGQGVAPRVILVVGVNGVGKTTSIGKLAWWYRRSGKRVIVVASDTFRAAALEQLGIWAERTGAELIRSKPGADPAAVAYDGVKAAQARGADVVLVDTAGRLQTKGNLMAELAKIARVLGKAREGAPDETLLVLDATVGQNALSQASLFSEAAPVTGIFLAKMDGTAKGGVVIALADRLGIPVRYVGLGEKPEDMEEFDPEGFARALLAPLADSTPGRSV